MRLSQQPKQALLEDLLRETGPHAATIIGGGGAKGGGKSAAADDIALSLASELGNDYKGLVITIIRRVSADLRDNHINKIFQRNPELLKYWRATDHDLRMHNGATILFRSAETKEDVRKRFLGGFESAIIIVDEAQQFDEEELQWIQTAARWTSRKSGTPRAFCKTLLLFNPGGPGSAYLRRVFWTHEYREQEKASDYAFVHIFGWDNYEWFRGQVDIGEEEFYDLPGQCQGADRHEERCCRFHMFINDTSEGRKYNAFPPSIRAGYLMGSFDHFEGQYFAGAWDQGLCTVSVATAARLIQPWWTRWGSMDWGWAGPPRPHYSVFLWWAIGKLSPAQLMDALRIESDYPLDVVIVYRERHANLTPEPQWADTVVDATLAYGDDPQAFSRVFVDGAIFSKDRRSENTTADLMQPIFSQAGFPSFTPADKDRVGGWRQLYNALLRTCNARRAPVTEPLEGPLLFVSADCPELCRSLPLLICDPDKPEDVLKTEALEDDYGDCGRYGYKSMMAAEWEAPVAVRRKELYDSYDARTPEERTMSQMTALAMKMRMFDRDEKARFHRVRRRR